MDFQLQDFEVSSSNLDFIAEITAMVCKEMGKKFDNKFHHVHFAESDDYVDIRKDKKFHIVFVISPIDYGLKNELEAIKANSTRKIIKKIKETLNGNLTEKIKKSMGSGYGLCFNRYDGIIDIGYKVQRQNDGVLYVGFTHIYFGK